MADLHTLHNLFEDELRDVYDAERQILKALPKIIDAVSDESLREGLSKHLDETRGHVNRLEQAFESLELKANEAEEKAADAALTKLAESTINRQARAAGDENNDEQPRKHLSSRR